MQHEGRDRTPDRAIAAEIERHRAEISRTPQPQAPPPPVRTNGLVAGYRYLQDCLYTTQTFQSESTMQNQGYGLANHPDQEGEYERQIPPPPAETPAARRERHRKEFLRNPEARVPCLVLVDNSFSMFGDPIDELNAGLRMLWKSLSEDELAAKRADVSIVSFGDEVRIQQDFATVQNIQIPELVADGGTPMSAAILHGLNMLDERKQAYRENGISPYRPWIFLLTDGEPTDMPLWPNAVQEVRRGKEKHAFEFFAIGVGEAANLKRLAELTTADRPPARLKGLQFGQFFTWLGESIVQYSRSKPGDRIQMPPPGWMELG